MDQRLKICPHVASKNLFSEVFDGRETYSYFLFTGYVVPPSRVVVDN